MKDIVFGLKLAFAIFFTIFSLILPIVLLFMIASHLTWWSVLFGLPAVCGLIALEICICGYMWEEWIDD